MFDGTDLDGDLRIWNSEVDIGAYELPIIHVATDGNPVPPYATWSEAATNPLQAASVARRHSVIWVAPGTYPITSVIRLTGSVAFVSVSGAAGTTIRGNGATRCFEIGPGPCVIDGFTIAGGATNFGSGGGVYINRGGTVRNCLVYSNTAAVGGGIFCFTSGVVERCVLKVNTASTGGGAIYVLNGGRVENCLVYSNSAAGGGGIFLGYGTGMVRNCTVALNTADEGGGIYCGPQARVENSIVWHNSAGSANSNHYESGGDIAWSNCCTAPAIGTACVDEDPRFADVAACDFRIGTNSPCVDAGINALSLTNDFAGMMRPLDGDRDGVARWDIGAYEAVNAFADTDGNGLPDGWEYQYFSWPVSGADPNADPDADFMNNFEEAVADTDPFDAASYLVITNLFVEEHWRTMQFLTSSNRVYTLQWSTNGADWRVGAYVRQPGNGRTRSWKITNDVLSLNRVWVELP